MKILCIAQAENSETLEKELRKQTVIPDEIIFHIDKEPATGINNRRKRIAYNHNTHLRPIVISSDADLIWQVEQDSILETDTLERLISRYNELKDNDFGYISGIQVGRHGLYCLGAWKNFTDDSFESLDYKLDGLQEIEATGFYCLLAPKDIWLSGTCEWNNEPYGPDVNWSRSINKKKYCDMDIKIGHKVKGGIIRPEHISTCNVVFYKENNEWKFKQLD